MRPLRACAAAFALSAFAHAGWAATPSLRWAADVPLRECDGMPCIDAALGAGATVTVGIDTGNILSVVDSRDGAALGIPHNPKAPYDRGHITAHIAGLTLGDLPAAAFPLRKAVAARQMPTVDATLAYTAFQGRVLQLDFPARRLRVSDTAPPAQPCAASCGSLHLITFGTRGPMIVVADGLALGSHALTAQIDTMFTGAVLVYGASIGKLGLERDAAAPAEIFPFTDGGVKMQDGPRLALAYGGAPMASNAQVLFPMPGVHEPDGLFDGTIGLAALRDHVVTLDFAHMTMSLG